MVASPYRRRDTQALLRQFGHPTLKLGRVNTAEDIAPQTRLIAAAVEALAPQPAAAPANQPKAERAPRPPATHTLPTIPPNG
ncbi:hypothetical protein CCR85_12560 [Rhodothalassium salexigens]|uniref:hypothetical protein n=1 Tax=Rhodothalassium salexigens TaxID=1086 RepID=UPI0019148428|nr:hypothetical protein [Rhodothalassium salexigens]MBK5912322.1 hypothetical protein [Rhodothalassium salexigens]MBK5920389.1 hypothetical protein [Rhodothalassium salexigens]